MSEPNLTSVGASLDEAIAQLEVLATGAVVRIWDRARALHDSLVQIRGQVTTLAEDQEDALSVRSVLADPNEEFLPAEQVLSALLRRPNIEAQLEALAYFLAAASLARGGSTFPTTEDRLAALELAHSRCERARRRAERTLPHLIDTWVEVPR
jgi:hypothetical protein